MSARRFPHIILVADRASWMRGSGLRLVMAGAFRSVVRGSREVVAAAGVLVPVAAGPAAGQTLIWIGSALGRRLREPWVADSVGAGGKFLLSGPYHAYTELSSIPVRFLVVRSGGGGAIP